MQEDNALRYWLQLSAVAMQCSNWGAIVKSVSESDIQLLEYQIPPLLVTKNAHVDISGTKRGIIDPLVSKRPENISEKEI